MPTPAPSVPFAELLRRFRALSVLVVGDVCLDRYVLGRATRLSREAPVPVLEWTREYCLPGEASNPALNIASLGAAPKLVALVGGDTAGRRLRSLLRQCAAADEHLVEDPDWLTTEKTRVLAEGLLVHPQQVARIDRSGTSPPSPEQLRELCERIEQLAPGVDAVLLSDYKHGAIGHAVIDCARDAAKRVGMPVTVDSQGDLLRFRGYDCVRCNRAEAEAVLGRPLLAEADFERELPQLHARVGCRGLVVTRDQAGLSLYSEADGYRHIPGVPVPVQDAVGAGDTVIAVLTLALAAGESLPVAARVANTAAALVVQHLGNAAPTPHELLRALGGRDG